MHASCWKVKPVFDEVSICSRGGKRARTRRHAASAIAANEGAALINQQPVCTRRAQHQKCSEGRIFGISRTPRVRSFILLAQPEEMCIMVRWPAGRGMLRNVAAARL